MLKELISNSIGEAIEIQKCLNDPSKIDFIHKLAECIFEAWQKDSKIIIAGNGGSLCDADHFAEELTGFFRSKNRPPIAAISLSSPSHMSCVGNDIGFDFVFSRAVEALAKKGDLFVVLTTSGNSINLVHAVESAKKLGVKTAAFLGKDGGKLKGKCDLEFLVEGFGFSDRVQEVHMSAIHIAIEAAEAMIFYALTPLSTR